MAEASVAASETVAPMKETVPRMKTYEEAQQDEGFLPPGVEEHTTEEEVAERLFSVGVPEEVKGIWGWAQSSFKQSPLSTIAEKALKSAEELAETVKTSAEEIAENVKQEVEKAKIKGKDVLKEINSKEFKSQPVDVNKKETYNFVYPWEPKTRFSSEIRERVLRLSEENNTFLVPPPEEVKFSFDFEVNADAATQMLETDPNLKKKRFELVPRQIDEFTFWRHYFYRVELIRRSYGMDENVLRKSQEIASSEADDLAVEETTTPKKYEHDEVDAKLLDDDDSVEFENDELAFESKKGQQESKKEFGEDRNLSWEEELQAEVDSENFDMLNEEEEILDEEGDDDDLEARIKAELSLS